jgi:hypothetical protein
VTAPDQLTKPGELAQTRDASRLRVSFSNCPRCGLSITTRAPWLAIRYCPRCLARSEKVVELFSSRLPAQTLYADGSGPWVQREETDRSTSGQVPRASR